LCEQLAQGRYLTANDRELNSPPLELQANALAITPAGHKFGSEQLKFYDIQMFIAPLKVISFVE